MSFGSPSAPAMPAPPPPPPPPPTINQARETIRRKDTAARRRGRAATVLSDQSSMSQVQPQTASKTLLGG